MTLKKIAVSFLERTSVRGVPRIVRHETWCLRALWLIGVLTLLGIAISQAVSIMGEYFEYPKVTLLKEESVIETFQSKDDFTGMKFPSLTVCNLNPFASAPLSDGLGDPTILAPAYYSAMIEQYLQYIPDVNNDMKNAKNYLRSYRGYFEYIGANNANKMGHRKQNLVAQCDVMFQAASTDRFKIPCKYEAIQNITSPEFFNCYTIGVDLANYTDAMGMPTGLSVVLHLDDGSQGVNDYYDDSNDNTQSTGVRVSVHTNNSAPDLWYSALDISPGSATQIMTRYTTRKRLGKPHGECLDTETAPVKLMNFNQEELAYTALSCMNSCTMDMVIHHCHCLDPSLLVISNASYVNYPTCGDLSAHDPINITATLTTLICSMNLKKLSILQCSVDCLPDCNEAKYTRTLAAAKWPKKSQHLSFYDQVIKDSEFEYRFKEYQVIEELAEKSNNSDSDELALNAMMSADLIERSFVKLSMYLEDMSVTVIEESPKVTMASMFSQLGGVLNLYIGISLVLVVELMELFYHLVAAVFKKSPASGNGNSMVQVKPATTETGTS